MHPSQISISDYNYHLPEEKIALHPLAERDASRLLVYREGDITESRFASIATLLPPGCLLVFNDSRVINARIRFQKSTGGIIEIFCLEPAGAVQEYSMVMAKTASTTWKCLVGGASKWKPGVVLTKEIVADEQKVVLSARLIKRLKDAYEIEFSWEPSHLVFAQVISAAGDTPLPPYIKRETQLQDESRYQTIFARQEGSVAAPTAGLHFTPGIFDSLRQNNIDSAFVSLHVGAGTFKPVKAAQMQDHDMHAEYISVSRQCIEQLLQNKDAVAAVGTTSLRTLETIYWFGVKAFLDPGMNMPELTQWEIYEAPLATNDITPGEALHALLAWMNINNLSQIFSKTQLLIAPGYRFRMAKMLVTNFHQPQSTLLLIIAAAIGQDWKKMYEYALSNDFRFLSYGDGNLIFIKQ